MDTFVVSEKFAKHLIKEPQLIEFMDVISTGKYDHMLFSMIRERSFNEGIINIKLKDGDIVPLLSFDYKSWKFVPPGEEKSIERNDGINIGMVLSDGKQHSFTVATYMDYVKNGETEMWDIKGDIWHVNDPFKPFRIIGTYPYVSDDEEKFGEEIKIVGTFALSLICKIQEEGLKMSEKVDKARNFNENQNNETENKKKHHHKGNPRVVYLGNHIKYQYELSDNNVHKEFERRCECWTVRGHYRHCKSGVICFVKPHVKGPKRDQEPVSKTYDLTPEFTGSTKENVRQ